MNHSSRLRISPRSAFALVALIPCSFAALQVAQADDLLGLYVGAAFGQAHIRAQLSDLSSNGYSLGAFDANHSAYQAMVGIRPLPFLGAEVTYMDLGQRSFGTPSLAGASGNGIIAEQASQKGEAAFGLLYLPVPIIDVYVKAGVSRIRTDTSATYVAPGVATCAIDNPNCAEVSVGRSATDTAFAYGAGVQWKLDQWAVRAEYERFDAAGANPSLLSIGMTYWLE